MNYLKNGIEFLKTDQQDTELVSALRSRLWQAFGQTSFPRSIYLDLIGDQFIIDNAMQCFASDSVKSFLSEIGERLSTEVTLFPHLLATHNYFAGPQCGLHGWHMDCGGETAYDFCRSKLTDESYVFGKISISLQRNNGEYGGNVDAVPSIFPNTMSKRLRSKFWWGSVNLQGRIWSSKLLRSLHIYNTWLFDFFQPFPIMRVDPEPLNPIAFDSRLAHRGTPVSPRGWKELTSKNPSISVEGYQIKGGVDMGPRNKYMFYAHFGNRLGLESYIYDRIRRHNGISEFEVWERQYAALPLFKEDFKESYPEFLRAHTQIRQLKHQK
jgi:hypothetical protein